MLVSSHLKRPNWTDKKNFNDIDLSKNVHFDKILNNKIKRILNSTEINHNYPNDYNIYECLSNYYNIPIENLSIGHGATDIIFRVIGNLDIKKLYIVEPTFAMVTVYCKMHSVNYEKINSSNAFDIKNRDSAIYLVNPNGNNGQNINYSELVNNFKYVISDEVYADFSSNFSLINNRSDNIIIIKSISKSLGLAGLRVGFSKSNKKFNLKIQNSRLSQVTNSLASIILPKIINETPKVVNRMKKTQKFLENKFINKKSYANYVLFKEPNLYTNYFNYKIINNYYRMSLTDMTTLRLAL